MAEPKVGMKFGNETTAMQRLKQLADKKHVPLEKTTSKLADGGNKIGYTVQTPYEGTLAGMTIFNFEDGTKYTELVDNGLLYLSSLNPWESQENKRFDTIHGEKYKAVDKNNNGIVDEGEIFPKK